MEPITVMMPVREFHPAFLREAVESILAQTSPDWRLSIIADRDRAPRIAAVVRPWLDDRRVSLLINEGRGLAGKFNTGMRRAGTEFVAILLGDDLWSQDAVAVLARHIRARPEVDFFHSSRIFVDEHRRPVSSVYRSRENVQLADFGPTPPVTHLFCWRLRVALACGGMDEGLASVGVDDFDFPWTMAEHGARFGAVPECLYIVRDHRHGFRLTTHVPLSVHKRELARMLVKHGVGAREAEEAVREAEHGYLRQCLYRSAPRRWLRERLGLGASTPVWYEPYR